MHKNFHGRQLADGGNDGITWKMAVKTSESGIKRDGGGIGAVIVLLEILHAFQKFGLDDGIRHEKSIGKRKRKRIMRLEVLIYEGVEGPFFRKPSIIGRLPATSWKRAIF